MDELRVLGPQLCEKFLPRDQSALDGGWSLSESVRKVPVRVEKLGLTHLKVSLAIWKL